MKKISKSNMDSDLILESDTKSYLWSIRPCHVYKGEIEKSFSYHTKKKKMKKVLVRN